MTKSNLTIPITANTADLRQKFATAKAETSALSAEFAKLARAGAGAGTVLAERLDGVLIGPRDRDASRCAEAPGPDEASLLDAMNDPNLTPEKQEALRERAVREYYGTGDVDPDTAEKLEDLETEGFVSLADH